VLGAFQQVFFSPNTLPSNDVDPLETPYTGSTLDLIHGQVHQFHGIE